MNEAIRVMFDGWLYLFNIVAGTFFIWHMVIRVWPKKS